MSNSNAYERLYKLQSMVGKLVLDGRRDPTVVADHLQVIIDTPSPTTPVMFEDFVDLGIITVPKNYKHSTQLATFDRQNRKKFYYYNDHITDTNFAKPSRILKPGDKFRVRVWKQVASGTTTSEQRMAFLASQQAVYVGAQGASIVFEQKRNKLPKGYWYVSMDKKEALPVIDGDHRVPYVYRGSDGDFGFYRGNFEEPWGDVDCLLCFCDCQPSGA